MNIFKRVLEPSSMAGIAALAAIFGIPHANEVIANGSQIVAGIAGIAAIFIPEQSSK